MVKSLLSGLSCTGFEVVKSLLSCLFCTGLVLSLFLLQDAMLAQYMLLSCVRLSVCLSVTCWYFTKPYAGLVQILEGH